MGIFKLKQKRMAKGTQNKTQKTQKTVRKVSSGKRKVVSKSTKAGIKFPVARMTRYLRVQKQSGVKRVGATAGVFLAAAMEYVVAEIMNMAGENGKELKVKRIMPKHLLLAFRNDDELSQMTKGVTFPRIAGQEKTEVHPALQGYKKIRKGLKEGTLDKTQLFAVTQR